MPKIVYIRSAGDKQPLRIGVSSEGESVCYTVSRRAYAELGMPAVGAELSDGEMSALCYADESYRAEKKALFLLALADNNRVTLMRKLVLAGFNREIAEEACALMISLGYIDEQRQLRTLVLADANRKFYGPGRIIPRLAAKGYRTEDIRAVMRSLVDEGEIDFNSNAHALIDKKGAKPDEKKTILYKYGYKI